MSNWCVKNLGDALCAFEEQERIREIIDRAWVDSGRPDEMAAFFRHESEGRLHCDLKIYFSPELSSVATLLDAMPCEKPAPLGLGLLSGSEGSWRVLFPEHDLE